MSQRKEGSRRGRSRGRATSSVARTVHGLRPVRTSAPTFEVLENRRLLAATLVGMTGNKGDDSPVESEALWEINLLKPGKGGSLSGFQDAANAPAGVLTPGALKGVTSGAGSLEFAVPQDPNLYWGFQSGNIIDQLKAGATQLAYEVTMNGIDLNGGSFGEAGSGDDSYNGWAQSNRLAIQVGGEWFQQFLTDAGTDDTGRAGQWSGQDGTHYITWDLSKFARSETGKTMAEALADPANTSASVIFVTQGADDNGNQGPMRWYFDNVRFTTPAGDVVVGDFEPGANTKITSLPFLADTNSIGFNPENGLLYRTGGSESWSNNPTSSGYRDNQAMHTVDLNSPTFAQTWVFNANPEQFGQPAPRPTWVLPTERRTDEQNTNEYRDMVGDGEYHGVRDLAWSTTDHAFFAADEDGLFKITPAGASTFVGNSIGRNLKALSFFTVNGERRLLGTSKSGSELWTIDPATGDVVDTVILYWSDTESLLEGVVALEENPDDPTMLIGVAKAEGTGGSDEQAYLRELVQIDPVTGVVTSLGPLGAHIASIAFVPQQAPVVTDVYVRNPAWLGDDANAENVTFKEYLQAQGVGNTTYGFKVAANPTNADTVPWLGVDEVVLRYSAPVTGSGVPTPASITLDGVRSDYAVTSVTAIDDRTFVLKLNRPLGNQPEGGNQGDRVRLSVPGGGPGASDFHQMINVLQGDANRDAQGRVNSNDQGFVKSRLNRSTNAPTSPTQSSYSVFADVDGSGRINSNDQGAVKARLNDSLGAVAAATLETFSSTRIADEVLA
jgi:hypothetical protein